MKEQLTTEAPIASFISANGKDGFFSLYDEVFAPQRFDRIFILAGGPGTGKSTLLRRVASAAQEHGLAYEQILCSSDPDSLDGVILARGTHRVGILDGTPPHGRIASVPAVIEEVRNLGEFWDAGQIAYHKAEILALTERKRMAYARAYALLRALGAVKEEERLFLTPHFNAEKAGRQIKHKIGPLRLRGEKRRRFLRALSARGETVLPFRDGSVQNLLLISGKSGTAEIYLTLFAKMLEAAGLAHTLYLSPLSPSVPDAIYLPENKTLLVKEELWHNTSVKGRRIVADRFFSLRTLERKGCNAVAESLKRDALGQLSEAFDAHRAIEGYFSAAMDFARLSAYGDKIVQEIVALLGV